MCRGAFPSRGPRPHPGGREGEAGARRQGQGRDGEERGWGVGGAQPFVQDGSREPPSAAFPHTVNRHSCGPTASRAGWLAGTPPAPVAATLTRPVPRPAHRPTVMRGRCARIVRPTGSAAILSRIRRAAPRPQVSPTAATRSPRAGLGPGAAGGRGRGGRECAAGCSCSGRAAGASASRAQRSVCWVSQLGQQQLGRIAERTPKGVKSHQWTGCAAAHLMSAPTADNSATAPFWGPLSGMCVGYSGPWAGAVPPLEGRTEGQARRALSRMAGATAGAPRQGRTARSGAGAQRRRSCSTGYALPFQVSKVNGVAAFSPILFGAAAEAPGRARGRRDQGAAPDQGARLHRQRYLALQGSHQCPKEGRGGHACCRAARGSGGQAARGSGARLTLVWATPLP
jgi:hypothetical protein